MVIFLSYPCNRIYMGSPFPCVVGGVRRCAGWCVGASETADVDRCLEGGGARDGERLHPLALPRAGLVERNEGASPRRTPDTSDVHAALVVTRIFFGHLEGIGLVGPHVLDLDLGVGLVHPLAERGGVVRLGGRVGHGPFGALRAVVPERAVVQRELVARGRAGLHRGGVRGWGLVGAPAGRQQRPAQQGEQEQAAHGHLLRKPLHAAG